MSEKLPVLKAREVVRLASHLGFMLDHQRGSHSVYYRERDNARIVIPMHSGKDLKPKTLRGILEDMDLTVEEFRKLL